MRIAGLKAEIVQQVESMESEAMLAQVKKLLERIGNDDQDNSIQLEKHLQYFISQYDKTLSKLAQ